MKYFVALYDDLIDIQLGRLYPLDDEGWFRDSADDNRFSKNWEDATICVQLGADE